MSGQPDDDLVSAVADAIAEAYDQPGYIGDTVVTRAHHVAGIAVAAYEREVLSRRPDAGRLAEVERYVQRHAASFRGEGECWIDREVPFLLAALATETAARARAERDRDTLRRVRDEAVAKMADYAERCAVLERSWAPRNWRSRWRSRWPFVRPGRGLGVRRRRWGAARGGRPGG